MEEQPIMTDLEILYQADYFNYQDFFSKELKFDENKGTILFISAIKGSSFKEIRGKGFYLEEFIQNGTDRLLREEIYVCKEDKCYRIIVSFNKNGIKKYKNIYEISIDNLLEELNGNLGNTPEIIRLLRLNNMDEKANNLERKYQYYLENINRLSEIKEKVIKEDIEEIQRLEKFPDFYDDLIYEDIFDNE